MTMYSKRTTIIFLLILLLIAVALACDITSDFIRPVAFAIILGVVFYPLHEHMLRWTRHRAGLASLLTTLALLFLFGIPVVIILLMAANEAFAVAHFLSHKSAEQGGFSAFVMNLADQPLRFIGRWIDLTKFDINAMIRGNMQRMSVWTFGFGAGVLGNFARFIGSFLITLVVVFFLFRDGKQWAYRAGKLMPLTPEQVSRLFQNISDTIVANVYGIVSVGVVQGILVGVALRIAGIPSSLLLGLAASFASIIPVVGCAVVWAPAAIYLLVTGSIGKGIFLVIWGTVVVGTVDNLLRPLVVSGKVELHPLGPAVLYSVTEWKPSSDSWASSLAAVVASVLAALFEDSRARS